MTYEKGTDPNQPLTRRTRPTHEPTQPPREPNVGDNTPEAGDKMLQNVLPEITEVAQKVGGFKKLSELADMLDEMGK
jgi:hypothetical protein